MKPTTRTIDEILETMACRDCTGYPNQEHAQALKDLLSTIKASLPEKNGTDTHEQDKGWNACLTQVEQELNKLFSHD